MNKKAWKILTDANIQQWLEENLDQDPQTLAFQHRHNEIPWAEVLTQLKYLQKARFKLPTYYNSRCILPPRAYEQASSERAAQLKQYQGKRCLDLTMGLGVDSWHFSQRFEEVVSLEPNAELAAISAYNFQQMGASGVKILTQTAESFLKSYAGPPFDLIYVDPSRRDQHGNRLMDPNAWQPNLQEILPLMQQHSQTLLLKLSPLFDWKAAWLEFPGVQRIDIISIDSEVKELLVEMKGQQTADSAKRLHLQILRGEQTFEFSWLLTLPLPPEISTELPQVGHYLYEPDVAFYKARMLDRIGTLLDQAHLSLGHPQGYLHSPELIADFPGRVMKIRQIWAFQPKALKKALQQAGIQGAQVSRRGFALSPTEIRKKLGLTTKGREHLVFTQCGGQRCCFWVEKG
ncbi:MAG: hypothetical protein AAF399_11690 [Bacteroidota bacterium]